MKQWFSTNRKLLLRLGGTFLAIGLLLFLIYGEWAEIKQAFREIDVIYLVIATGIMFVSRFFVVGRWYILLRSAGVKVPFSSATTLTFTGLFASNFLPTTVGGDLVRLAGIIQMGYDRPVSLASLAADRLVGMFGMAMTLPFGIYPVWHWNHVESLTIPALFANVWGFAKRTIQSFSIWLKKPLALAGALGCTWGHMLCTFVALYLLVLGLGAYIPFWTLAGFWSVTYFVSLLPVSVNGFGIQEISLVTIVSTVGHMTRADSIALALLIRAAFLLASFPGAFFLPAALANMDITEKDQ
jgi:uncharacterized membrane protein YbhN (UPF0104 family)